VDVCVSQSATLPSDKVDVILRAVRTIERLSDEEHADADADIEADADAYSDAEASPLPRRRASAPLGADDLFPIFVYVLVQVRLEQSSEL
jgi:hypothetical protein